MMTAKLTLAVSMAGAAALLNGQTPAPKPRSVTVTTRGNAMNSAYLGVAVLEVDADRAKALKLKEERGVEVKVVDDNSPASKAGLKENDVIQEYNGQRVEGLAQFIRMVSETPIGRKANMQVVRNGAPQNVTATIEARSGRGGFVMPGFPALPEVPVAPEAPVLPEMLMRLNPMRTLRIGVEMDGLGSQLAEYFGVKEGVLIRSVSPHSPAEKAGLKAGDVITKVGTDTVRNPQQIAIAVQTHKSLAFTVVRNHKEMNVSVKSTSDDGPVQEP